MSALKLSGGPRLSEKYSVPSSLERIDYSNEEATRVPVQSWGLLTARLGSRESTQDCRQACSRVCECECLLYRCRTAYRGTAGAKASCFLFAWPWDVPDMQAVLHLWRCVCLRGEVMWIFRVGSSCELRKINRKTEQVDLGDQGKNASQIYRNNFFSESLMIDLENLHIVSSAYKKWRLECF